MDQTIDNLSIQKKVMITEKFPNFLKVLFFVEMWERFSYYGMRALLVIFLTSHLGFVDTKAYAIYSLFAALCFAGPVLGGFLADKLLGFRNMVLLGGIVIALGHAFMTLVELKSSYMYLGLALIVVGSGMFKGNVANLLGTCYHIEDQGRTRGFTLFYVSINLGSFLAVTSCSYIAHLYGWHYGFGLAGIGMVMGLITFIKFQYLLGNNGLSPRPGLMKKKIFGINMLSIILIGSFLLALMVSRMLMHSETFSQVLTFSGLIILSVYVCIILKSSSEQKRNLIALSILIIFFMCFFALEMQLGSLINLFAKRNVVNELLGITVPSTMVLAINPLSIIILGFFLGTYTKFNKQYATIMFVLGLLTMAVCFFILYIGCLNANADGKIEYIYLICSISCMGLGELCITPLVYNQATLLAPKNFKGLIMGIVMLSLAFSNLAGIIISKFMSIPSFNGEVDSLESLIIYREGFLKIAMFNVGIAIIFLLFFKFLHNVITTSSPIE